MHTDQQPDVGNHELVRIVRPLLIAMELVGGWVYPTKKWSVKYIVRNIYCLTIILLSLLPIAKLVLMIDVKAKLGYDISSQMTISTMYISAFINAMLSYRRYSSIPNFLNLVFLNSWPCVNKYRKCCHILIRTGVVAMIIVMIINNFAWVVFNIPDLQPSYIDFAKPFDNSNMSVWITLLVTSVICFPTFLSFLYNGIFLLFTSWVLYRSFKKLSEDMSRQHDNDCLADHLDLHKMCHFELTRLVATLDSISAGYLGASVLMFAFNSCLITYQLSVSTTGVSLYGSIVVLLMSVGFFLPIFYASDQLNNAVSVHIIRKNRRYTHT